MIQVIEHHHRPLQKFSHVHESAFRSERWRSELIQFGLLDAMASQSDFIDEGFETFATTDFFLHDVRGVVLQVAPNNGSFSVSPKLFSGIAKFTGITVMTGAAFFTTKVVDSLTTPASSSFARTLMR